MSAASDKLAELESARTAWRRYRDWRKFGQLEPARLGFRQRALSTIAIAASAVAMRGLATTIKWSLDCPDTLRTDLLAGRKRCIFPLWHNRLLSAAMMFERHFRRIRNSFVVAAIISRSRDGELISRPVRELGGLPVRGSSSRGGVSALRDAVAALEGGANLFVAGDGPVGPRYQLKPGVVQIAKLTGVPIVPVCFSCDNALQFRRSWDQTIVPLPFSRVRCSFGEPITVAGDADEDALAEARREVEALMLEQSTDADRGTIVRVQFPRPRPGERPRKKRGAAINPRRL